MNLKTRVLGNNLPVKWYLSSDSWKAIGMLKTKFEERIVLGKGNLGHTTHFPDTYTRTILDNELLSKCNEIIVTGGSSFGFVAALKTGRLPFFIEGRRKKSPAASNQTTQNSPDNLLDDTGDQCQRMRLSRPPKNIYGVALF